MPWTSQSKPSKFLKNDNIILDQKLISLAVYSLGNAKQGKPKIAIIAVIKISKLIEIIEKILFLIFITFF